MSNIKFQPSRYLASNHPTLSSDRLCQVIFINSSFIEKPVIFSCRKVKETLHIAQLKERHPDRWEQHKNAQIQQGQMEQRIVLRLREIYSARSEQSSNIFNELNRLQTMIDDEHTLISSLDKQSQIYQQLSNYLNELSQLKEQLNLFTSTNRSNQQGEVLFISLLIGIQFGVCRTSNTINRSKNG